MKKLALHWKIMIGMLLGILFGILMIQFNGGNTFIANWIKPIGTIFVNLLKLIAIPLILASLIKGVSDLKDISQLSKMGLRTLSIYILTTLIAICIGLTLVNIAQPGAGLSTETIASLSSEYAGNENVQSKLEEANKQMNSGPLKFLVDIVPQNAFSALSDNSLMLQVIFIALFIGVCLLLVPETKAKPLKDLFDSLNEVVLKMVDVIMLLAPFAVFALLADVVASSADPAVLLVLLKYALVVLTGLIIIIIFYLISIAVLVRKSPFWFLKELSPALLTAFSTSSSAATLPVTMERVEEHLGVDGEVASFVLPLGATINMDGTSLYQAVAAVFIAQALGFTLDFNDQLIIVFTALLASIGAAGVPGAGMVMLVIVLESVGFPPEQMAVGLALIFAVDRPLDMCRTTINVMGDAMVALVVAKSLGKLGAPNVKNLNDYYPNN